MSRAVACPRCDGTGRTNDGSHPCGLCAVLADPEAPATPDSPPAGQPATWATAITLIDWAGRRTDLTPWWRETTFTGRQTHLTVQECPPAADVRATVHLVDWWVETVIDSGPPKLWRVTGLTTDTGNERVVLNLISAPSDSCPEPETPQVSGNLSGILEGSSDIRANSISANVTPSARCRVRRYSAADLGALITAAHILEQSGDGDAADRCMRVHGQVYGQREVLSEIATMPNEIATMEEVSEHEYGARIVEWLVRHGWEPPSTIEWEPEPTGVVDHG